MQAGLQEGEKPPKMRAAREDDKFVISRDVEVTMNKITTPDGEYGPLTMRLMWSVKSRDVAIEFKEENAVLHGSFEALGSCCESPAS